MLSQLENLSREVDGCYASDLELQFIEDYVQSFGLRLQTYQRLQELQPTLLKQVYLKMQSQQSAGFTGQNDQELIEQCYRDLVYCLQLTAAAVLFNDPERLEKQLRLLPRMMMQPPEQDRLFHQVYGFLQELVPQHLTTAQADLVCPILRLNHRRLGAPLGATGASHSS
jgi:hypothetical protein